MTDRELAQALELDDQELAEAFGYCDRVVDNMFQDDDYQLDTCGLKLIEDVKRDDKSATEDEILAAEHGYHNMSCVSVDSVELAAEFGYSAQGALSEAHSVDSVELAAEFGYGSQGVLSESNSVGSVSQTSETESSDDSTSDSQASDVDSNGSGYDSNSGTTEDEDYSSDEDTDVISSGGSSESS